MGLVEDEGAGGDVRGTGREAAGVKRCRAGHLLHHGNSRLVRHSKTGRTWLRCLICHAERQHEFRREKKQV
jgi:hypothetical protein